MFCLNRPQAPLFTESCRSLSTVAFEGIEKDGFELNKELENFYTAYRADRPSVGEAYQDWTLPEAPDMKPSDLIRSIEEEIEKAQPE